MLLLLHLNLKCTPSFDSQSVIRAAGEHGRPVAGLRKLPPHQLLGVALLPDRHQLNHWLWRHSLQDSSRAHLHFLLHPRRPRASSLLYYINTCWKTQNLLLT